MWTAYPAGPYALIGHKKELVTLAGRVLASACAMELHSALEHAQSVVNRQQVIGLVEEVSVVSSQSTVACLQD